MARLSHHYDAIFFETSRTIFHSLRPSTEDDVSNQLYYCTGDFASRDSSQTAGISSGYCQYVRIEGNVRQTNALQSLVIADPGRVNEGLLSVRTRLLLKGTYRVGVSLVL